MMFAVVTGLLMSHPVRSAEISVTEIDGTPVFLVFGSLTSDDGQKFTDKIAGHARGVVILSSDGGSLQAGLEIGTIIRFRGFRTVVPAGVRCASACALAWLGGSPRSMAQGALVGFHAASKVDDGQAVETGVGNALVGAYLNRLGLPDAAVVYITQASPAEMTWLTPSQAILKGIDVKILASAERQNESPTSAKPFVTPDPPRPAPQARQPSPPRRQQKVKWASVKVEMLNLLTGPGAGYLPVGGGALTFGTRVIVLSIIKPWVHVAVQEGVGGGRIGYVNGYGLTPPR